MKNMKKLWAALLALAMTFSLAACSGTSDEETTTDDQTTEDTATDDTAAESDLAYVQDKGTLVVGITEFEPMDYQDADGNWIGFDADLASEFAESLGVSVQFQGDGTGRQDHRRSVERHDPHRRCSGRHGVLSALSDQPAGGRGPR